MHFDSKGCNLTFTVPSNLSDLKNPLKIYKTKTRVIIDVYKIKKKTIWKKNVS